ncbi:hypothetical protein A2Z67_04575 [Candidatus Woesebacteria bacterium RBG_13_36_22]|uniref:Tyrosine specific protein phosphatases domain-containing protein n=1 Tax=Candidatus Woesebacteria bacterium RBG_13_36_22 TaxID=1802478 RepID=A0A1F7X2H7_9BACT|nr:MAG: hypothetical protein A2Z67_04575 [Candidatus Woesebacteria bacterium RBG_13_36_22]
MKLIAIIENYLFKNMGTVKVGSVEIVRSGQPGRIRRWIIYKLTKFRNIINLADSPVKDEQDPDEREWARKKGIGYYSFTWGAGGPTGPTNYDEVDQAVTLLSTLKSSIWVHCEGGKDRTGGLIGIFQARQGCTWQEISKDWDPWYGEPAYGWLQAIQLEIDYRWLNILY